MMICPKSQFLISKHITVEEKEAEGLKSASLNSHFINLWNVYQQTCDQRCQDHSNSIEAFIRIQMCAQIVLITHGL